MNAPARVSQILEVRGRRRLDPMSVSRLADFRLRASRHSDADNHAQHWTPYCMDAKSGCNVLVASPPDIDLSSAPFYYHAQYQHAQRVKLVNATEFVALGEAQRPTFTKSVMIYSTGRAGTTLVSKMFARLPSCVSLSEPDYHTSLLEVGAASRAAWNPLRPDVEPDESSSVATADLLRAANQLYFQPTDNRATHLVLKFRGMCVELAGDIRRAHPGGAEFFLYRDAESYVGSSMRAFSYRGSPLWAIRWLHGLGVTRPFLTMALSANFAALCRFFPVVAQYSPRELGRLGPVGLLAISWLSMIDRARQLALPSLRYETLLHGPRAAVERLLQRSGLSDDVEPALAAMQEDSQRGSVVGRERTTRYELSARDRKTIRSVLARHAVIDRGDYELPHAIV